jgi:uncharacterized protein (TIGR00369 family)
MATEQIAALQDQSRRLFAGTLGVEVVEAAPERVVGRILVRPQLCTVPGIMHGGAIMAFADTLGAMGTSLNLPPGAGTTTIESKTNFFAPGIEGTQVIGACTPLHRGRTTMVWQTRVTGEDGRLLALVTQTQAVLAPRRTDQETMAALFEGKDLAGQKELLAKLERGGAEVYRAMARSEDDPDARAALLAAAEREEENARLLEG